MTFVKKQKGRDKTISGSFVIPVTPFLLLLFLVVCAGVTSAQDLGTIQTNIASGNVELVRNALFQIRVLHSETASRLAVPALNSPNEIVRATAADAVIYLPKNEAVQALAPLLGDKAEFVRTEAAHALGEVRDPSAATPLINTLENDKSRVVKAAAAVALGKSGNIAAVDPLAKVLRSSPNEDNEFLRRSATHAIGRIAESQTNQRPTTTTPENFLPEKYKTGYLTKSGEPTPPLRAATAVVSKVLQNKKEADDTRREAAFALGAIGDPAIAPLLRSYLNAPDNYLAEICKEALLKLAPK